MFDLTIELKSESCNCLQMKSDFSHVLVGDYVLAYRVTDGKRFNIASAEVIAKNSDEVRVLVPVTYRKSDGRLLDPIPEFRRSA